MLSVVHLLLLGTAAYVLVRYLLSYWTRNGTPQAEPSFPFGNTREAILAKKPFSERYIELYREAVAKGYSVYGIYVFLKPILLVADMQLAKQIMTNDFDHFIDRGTYVNEKIDPLSGTLFALAGSKWRNLRVKLTPVFTTAKLKAMFPTMEQCGVTLQKVLRNKEGTALNVQDFAARYATDIIAAVGFGITSNSLENPNEKFREIGKKIFPRDFANAMRGMLTFIVPTINKVLGLKTVLDEVEKYMLHLTKETITRRENGLDAERKDFVQLFLQLRNQGKLSSKDDSFETGKVSTEKNMSIEELAAQSFVFFLAGFETTASTINFCMFEICRNPDIQRRVHDEIDRVLADGPMTYDKLAEMKYLECCIDETLRKYPPAAILMRMCNKPYRIPDTNITIEKNTFVHIPIAALQRDERYYPDAMKFNPDRFSDGTALPHMAFGDGPRNCIGMRLGKLVTKMGLVAMLSQFTYRLHESIEDGELKMDPTLILMQPKQDMLIVGTKRNRGTN